jgi:hypothetical protein
MEKESRLNSKRKASTRYSVYIYPQYGRIPKTNSILEREGGKVNEEDPRYHLLVTY